MSVSELTPEPEVDERLWEQYLSDCRVNKLHPSISDYQVWLSDQDLDDKEYDAPDDYER